MYFYELHEGDDDLFADLLLAREDEMDPEEFFQTVQSIRERVLDSHGHDNDRLTAAVNVSRDPDENFLADLEGEDVEQEQSESDDDFLTILAERDGGRPRLPN
ncbi:MAG: hypothetical protein E6I94_06115 [Chloroflexi bacterium]|nr:MAG: hypothetical protein E6I94_06115 [Chloroflexota bacterium]